MEFSSFQLNSIFKLVNYKAGASNESIKQLEAASSIPVPNDYLNIIREATDAELSVGSKKYIRIWAPLKAIEMNEAYEIQKYIPKSLAIGDDEGGMALILMSGNSGPGLYKAGFGDLDPSDAIFISPSLDELLTNGVGVNRI